MKITKSIPKDIWVISIFFILTMLMIVPLWMPHQMLVQSDWSFHAARAEEIYSNLKSGHLHTYIASKTFNSTGVGSFLFYPTLFLYPWALLRFVVSPLSAYYIWLFIFIFIGFLVNYFCMKYFSNNRFQSIFFSLAYNMFPYHIFLGTGNFTLGEFVGTIFIPIVFLGFYNILFHDKNWLALPIGMSLIIYTHILTTFMTVEILFTLFICYFIIHKKIKLVIFYKLIKSVILCILLTLPIIVPFLTDYIGKNMQSAYIVINPSLLKSASELFNESINNINGVNIGIILLISIFGCFLLDSKDTLYKSCFFIGITLSLVSTTVFPWILVRNLPISAIQLPYRYLSYSTFFLSIYFSKVVLNIPLRHPKVPLIFYTLIVFSIFITCYFGSLASVIGGNTTGNNIPPLTQISRGNEVIPNPTLLNNSNYRYQFSYMVKFGETDYFPKKSLPYSTDITNNISTVNGKKRLYTKITSPNKISYTFNLEKASTVDLPIIRYTHTTLTVNNRNQSILNSKRGTVKAYLQPGYNKVTISYQPSLSYYISLILSITSFSILILVVLYKKIYYLSNK